MVVAALCVDGVLLISLSIGSMCKGLCSGWFGAALLIPCSNAVADALCVNSMLLFIIALSIGSKCRRLLSATLFALSLVAMLDGLSIYDVLPTAPFIGSNCRGLFVAALLLHDHSNRWSVYEWRVAGSTECRQQLRRALLNGNLLCLCNGCCYRMDSISFISLKEGSQ